jgi:hypothetical protein
MPIMTNTALICQKRKTKLPLKALLPLSAAFSGAIYAAEPVKPQSSEELVLDEVSVTATRDK